MKIFLSYASEDKPQADRIALSLRGSDHSVFLDRDALAAGDSYDNHIRDAINRCDLFVFLISKASLSQGKYTLTELSLARAKWPNPKGRVLPVLIDQIDVAEAPAYLKAVGILTPSGNVAAEVDAAVSKHATLPRLELTVVCALLGLATSLLGGVIPMEPNSLAFLVSVAPFAAFTVFALTRWGKLSLTQAFLSFVLLLAAALISAELVSPILRLGVRSAAISGRALDQGIVGALTGAFNATAVMFSGALWLARMRSPVAWILAMVIGGLAGAVAVPGPAWAQGIVWCTAVGGYLGFALSAPR